MTCRGTGKTAGMGGIPRECRICDGEGKVLKAVESIQPIQAVAEKTTPKTLEPQAIEPIKAAPKSKAKKPTPEPIEPITETMPGFEEPKKPIFAGYDDDFMEAILSELSMEPAAWTRKYQHIKKLFSVDISGQIGQVVSKVERNSIRLLYAQTQKIAPRKIDNMAMQDNVAAKDTDYLVYAAKDKAEQEEKEKKAKKSASTA